MKPWLIASLAAVCLWGLWGFCGKLASRSVASQDLLLLTLLGNIIVFPIYVALFGRHFKFLWQNADYYFAIISGVVGAIGAMFFYLAMSKAEVSRVVVVTAIYPVITVILACLFLHESMTAYKLLGMVLALFGIYLLSC